MCTAQLRTQQPSSIVQYDTKSTLPEQHQHHKSADGLCQSFNPSASNFNTMSPEEEGKKPSKKELKKLAKKAEKASPKESNGSATDEAPTSIAPNSAATSTPPPIYRLSNSQTDRCTLKACLSSVLHSITLHPSPPSSCPSFVHGPALLYGDASSSAPPLVAFGGNGIAKALSLAAGHVVSAVVDDWMEFERCQLRPALASKNESEIAKALGTVEKALESHGGTSLVGSTPLTLADVVVSISLMEAEGARLSEVVQSYVDITRHSPEFEAAKSLADSLLPPSLDESDPSLIRASSFVFATAISRVCPSVSSLGIETKAFKCKDIKHGDYQCNAAMPLFQKLKALGQLPSGVDSPVSMAEAIVAAIPEDNPVLDQITVAGPGFIMCRIKSSYLARWVNDLLLQGSPHKPKLSSPAGTVVVDFSSPNIAKEMHVGHLRSTIIGESVCRRILECVGHYRFDESPEFKKISQLNVVKLQAGDAECREIWQVLCDVSRKEFEKVYDRLDITVEECGESFYNDKIPPVIQEFERKGLISVEEGGAKCVFVPKFKVPLMLQKSDGGYGYDSTDMAAIKYRLMEVKASHIVYITDFTQGDHFQMVFAAAKKIGWVTDESHRLDHIGFGTVQGEDGKRFKTRSGDTVRLVDLLDEAVARMESSLKERSNIPPEEIHATASAMGYGAVKYFDLRRNPTSNYIFSYDRMLDTKGNTAIYLLYAHARLESIVTKGKAEHGVDVDSLLKEGNAKITLNHKSERNLGLHLQFFADSIEETLKDLLPYHICDFIYALSIAASEFVTQCKVLGSPEMESRLLLCRATAITMRQCFDLLGIRHVMRI
ncbi:hypothetical protein ACHAW6_005572 [Cyclotella cf. meneghiniana]